MLCKMKIALLLVALSCAQFCTSFSTVGIISSRAILPAKSFRLDIHPVLSSAPRTRVSCRAFSTDVSENRSDGREFDVEARAIQDDDKSADNLLDSKDFELQFNLLKACAGLDRQARENRSNFFPASHRFGSAGALLLE
jgi:hypothetical protein